MKKRFKVAVLMDVSRAYDRDVLTGITNFNKIHDKFVFFFFSPRYVHNDNQAAIIKRLVKWRPDGVLTREVDGFKQMLKLNVPLIIFPHTNLYKNEINVWGDNHLIGQVSAEYFINRGYKSFGFLGFKGFQWSVEREKGFVEYVGKFGHSVNAFNFDNKNLLWEELPTKLVDWLKVFKNPTAIFSATDELNILLLEAAKNAGLKVPDDLSIMGVDNDALICETTNPTLSSIDHNAWQYGFQAAMILSRWMEHGERPDCNIICKPGTIVLRNSTNIMAIEDEQVRTALHYITNVAPSEDISVDDVVKVTTLSRRILEKRFQRLIKSSVLEEIKKARIQRIKYLLEYSELSILQIASELNFRNFDNITRYFKQFTGINPKEYRNQFRRD
ncbi:DNA-binding transcriptional regulator [Danxiaibacter flavus]|uniref:DNA-binding transcriptional regulator n=1 Tax=Danxiaibacter flavus TaxID=3049108 RepID=A0ABV3ZN93_9BACT|nr:DNA-binding transcriptional regulator [Chitinophagaceae bacterium DXS]